jgi:hypothetical protein
LLPDVVTPVSAVLNTVAGTLQVVFSDDLAPFSGADLGVLAWDGTDAWQSTDLSTAANQATWALASLGPSGNPAEFDYPNAAGNLQGVAGATVPPIVDFPVTVVP